LPHEEIQGDAGRGQQIVSRKGGCLQCHSIGLEGGRLGPALTEIGARSSPAHIRAKLLDAASAVPDDFRVVELKTNKGQTVSGVRLNEDVWSIQVRDFRDQLHSFWKQDLADLKVEKRTPMPSYRERFNAQELNDVVAYLAGLRGGR
jgi:putative heme-binding domain-containing protein